MDVGENASVLDRINLTFVYDKIGVNMDSISDAQDEVCVNLLISFHDLFRSSRIDSCHT